VRSGRWPRPQSLRRRDSFAYPSRSLIRSRRAPVTLLLPSCYARFVALFRSCYRPCRGRRQFISNLAQATEKSLVSWVSSTAWRALPPVFSLFAGKNRPNTNRMGPKRHYPLTRADIRCTARRRPRAPRRSGTPPRRSRERGPRRRCRAGSRSGRAARSP
jgi:hypothetical protein